MSDTNFTNGISLTDAAWFNDLNDLFYTAMGGVAGSGTITKVQFPATQVSSADANALDDYEEGDWTPVFTFATPGDLSVTYAEQDGSYVKIGQSVTETFNILTSAFTHTTASSIARITGSGFTANNNGINNVGAIYWAGITKANYTHAQTRKAANGTVINIGLSGSGQAADNADPADMPTGGTVRLDGSITFRASA